MRLFFVFSVKILAFGILNTKKPPTPNIINAKKFSIDVQDNAMFGTVWAENVICAKNIWKFFYSISLSHITSLSLSLSLSLKWGLMIKDICFVNFLI